jgi:nitrate reductase NapE component
MTRPRRRRLVFLTLGVAVFAVLTVDLVTGERLELLQVTTM